MLKLLTVNFSTEDATMHKLNQRKENADDIEK
jgi:hypothetical protein